MKSREMLARLRTVAPQIWLILLLGLLLVAFAVILIVQPTAVGRGGR